MKSNEMCYITYDDLESLIKKIGRCRNNSKKFLAIKIVERISLGF